MADNILFMLRTKWYDLVASGKKKSDWRKATKRWMTVAQGRPKTGVFMCGNRILRLPITGIIVHAGGFPGEMDDELRAILGTGPVIEFKLG